MLSDLLVRHSVVRKERRFVQLWKSFKAKGLMRILLISFLWWRKLLAAIIYPTEPSVSRSTSSSSLQYRMKHYVHDRSYEELDYDFGGLFT
jgi:hypothetical protein